MSDELKWAAYVMISPPFVILMSMFLVCVMAFENILLCKITAIAIMAYVLFIMCAMIF